MMSEDSDYTSDVNFPLQHQHNMSAHQYGADHDVIDNDVSWHHHHPQHQQPYYHANAGYYGNYPTPQSRGRYIDGYHDDRSGYSDYYNYEHGDDRSSRLHGYYEAGGYRRQQRYRPERSDSESEPLSYNSRPQSYYTDRCVFITNLPVFYQSQAIVVLFICNNAGVTKVICINLHRGSNVTLLS